MKLFAVSLCWFVLGTCPITFGQSLFPSCERSDLVRQDEAQFIPQLVKCDVTGKWINELGSCMNISVVGDEVRGMYWNHAKRDSDAADAKNVGHVLGWISDAPHPTIAFSVLRKTGMFLVLKNQPNPAGKQMLLLRSCTAWVGQCFISPEGGQILKTLWILRSVADNPEDNWSSTRVGANDFIHKGIGECP